MKPYAYVAVPLVKGLTSRRAFCGDSRGVICVTVDGSMPDVIQGKCAASCPPIQ